MFERVITIRDREGKKLNGRKRRIVHDLIHTADVRGRDGAPLMLTQIVHRFGRSFDQAWSQCRGRQITECSILRSPTF